ncbi:MAG: cytochrome c [Pirellulales bacterium]|nr:cytochrome c [Pirellulales bacterium]
MSIASLAGWRGVAAICLAASLLFAAGCGQAPVPQFTLNMEGVDPGNFRLTGGEESEDEVDEKKRMQEGLQNLSTALYALFGTPDAPFVFPESGLDLRKLELAAGPAGGDRLGKRRGLYRENCVHCHGITGSGDGPTALFLKPYPRDFRRGIFKFTSTGPGARPTTEDLKRTLQNGIPGSAMPSFGLLPEDEIDALVEYVKYLSYRGETELSLRYYLDQEEPVPMERDALLGEMMAVVDTWNAAESEIVIPDQAALPPHQTDTELAASIARGQELFRDGKTAQCIKCHGPTGLGDGGQELYDDWNKDKTAENLVFWRLPPQRLDPRNLRLGIYRGGRRPVDIYRRVYAGIKGTPMPAAGNVLQPNQIWDLVNYVLSLPYDHESMAHDEQITLDRPRL